MKKTRKIPVWVKLIFPAAVFTYHAVFITQSRIIDLHWILYIALFVYVTAMGETKKIICEVAENLKQFSFLVKVLAAFLITLTVIVCILRISSESMYNLWLPLWNKALFLPWVFLYVLIQPMTDTVIFEKWLIGAEADNGAWMRVGALLAMVFRAYIETGEFVVKNGEMSMASLLYYVVVAVPILFYLFTKKASISFMGEVLYRISIAVMIIALL